MAIMKPSSYVGGNGKYVLYVLNVIDTTDKPSFCKEVNID
jgi:hypothetical protein